MEVKQKNSQYLFHSSHKDDELSKSVEKCLAKWNIASVFIVTIDYTSSNDKMLKYLIKKINNWRCSMLDGKFIHIRCIAHLINLMVGDGFKDAGDFISRIC